ncbi:RNA polymerase sigma factor SigZ [Mariniphaga sediminis]|uniref:RNA polymerase sigma factor SigZ n=1 Tax=Mariniphaga sediminis TaxID=1628158 RepID=A0A399CZT0_9BACT|nr:RNA polymerase sigma factor SigZ [Mariniphaga sediminis]RIH65104.1 RNA polymerase sigma factor SigZ [Mariniphaga sediminis]
MNDITENIWNDFHIELKNFILKKVKDENIANDILQDVFLKIINNADKIAQAKSVQQYIYGIARNTTIDHFRKSDKKNNIENDYTLISEEETESLNATIADCCIKPFIKQLPEKYQVALTKSEFENISQKDLAEQLNISYSGAKSRVQRGKEKLKELILACCNYPSDSYGNLRDTEDKNCACS